MNSPKEHPEQTISEFLAAAGRKGGQQRTEKQRAARVKNIAIARRSIGKAETIPVSTPISEQKTTTICARPGATLLIAKALPFPEGKA